MAYACEICGKGKQFGHNVSFSQRKTQKVWKPNLQKQFINLGMNRIQVRICTQCLRTLAKFRKADAAKAAEAPAEAPIAKKARVKTAKTAE